MKRLYFNNAAGAFPLAPGVAEAVAAAMAAPPRVAGRDALGSADSLAECRRKTGALLGVDPTRVALGPGATFGLNVAILGLDLTKGDFVVTSVMEHNSVLRPLAHQEDSRGIRVGYVPLGDDFGLDMDAYDRMLEAGPRLVALTHASNVTGRINPVGRLFEKAKSAGAQTLLDASQTAGRIPVLPSELHADMVVFPGHKGLRGPAGTGALYVAPGTRLRPVVVGGTGTRSDLRLQPEEMPLRLEAGTPNMPAFAGLAVAVSHYMERAGDIAVQEAEIARGLVLGLKALPRVRVFDDGAVDRLPVASFVIDGMDTETVGLALSESFGVECRAGLHCAPLMHRTVGAMSAGTVRLSPCYLDGPSEIARAVQAVGRIAE
jgi:selenocysteine lyase/cysteine desulfurase